MLTWSLRRGRRRARCGLRRRYSYRDRPALRRVCPRWRISSGRERALAKWCDCAVRAGASGTLCCYLGGHAVARDRHIRIGSISASVTSSPVRLENSVVRGDSASAGYVRAEPLRPGPGFRG
jgi:hypothetical protein